MSEHYNRILNQVEERLDAVVPRKPLPDWIARYAGEPTESITAEFTRKIIEPARCLLDRGGKRWRPVLMVFCCLACGGTEKEVLDLTPLVELAHNGSLIVDDIEDRSPTRRGGPAIHCLYGEDVAINTGSLLYFLPLRILSELSAEGLDKLLLHQLYCESLRRLHFGQGLDIQWHREIDFIPDRNAYMRMCRYKTGSLARFAGQAGALAAGAPKKAAVLGAIMEDMGLAFQIIDDITNLRVGNPGKTRGDDIIEGKKSLPIVLFGEESSPENRHRLFECLKAASRQGTTMAESAIKEAIGILENSGAIQKAENLGFKISQNCLQTLQGNLPDSPARSEIRAIIEKFCRT